jgi:hypothetical protein
MTKLAQAVLACISATMMLTGAAPIALADTFTYELNGSFAVMETRPSFPALLVCARNSRG